MDNFIFFKMPSFSAIYYDFCEMNILNLSYFFKNCAMALNGVLFQDFMVLHLY